MSEKEFEPKIIGFFCNWCTYAGADLAGVSRLQYPPNIRVIRVMCSGTVSPHHVLRAFQKGADGVLIGGCHIGDCHYLKGNYMTIKRMTFLQDLLKFTGMEDGPAAPGMDLRRRRSQIRPGGAGVYRKNQENGPLAPENRAQGGVTRTTEKEIRIRLHG